MSSYSCIACEDSHWWCRGCDGSDKMEALQQKFPLDFCNEIYHYQFDSCDTPLIPCFLCNRDGSLPLNSNLSYDAEFWREYLSDEPSRKKFLTNSSTENWRKFWSNWYHFYQKSSNRQFNSLRSAVHKRTLWLSLPHHKKILVHLRRSKI